MFVNRITEKDYAKTTAPIYTKFGGKVALDIGIVIRITLH